MAHVGINQAIPPQLARPDGNNTPGMRELPNEVKRIDLQAGLKQQLQVVEQQRVVGTFLVRDLPQQFACGEATHVVWRGGQPPAKFEADVERLDVELDAKLMQQLYPAAAAEANEQDQLAVEVSDLADAVFEVSQHTGRSVRSKVMTLLISAMYADQVERS